MPAGPLALEPLAFSAHLGVAVPHIELKHVVAATIGLKGLGSLLFILSSSLGAYLLLLYLALITPIIHDFYNYDMEKAEFAGLFAKFTQDLALIGALLFFLGMKNSIPKRQGGKKSPRRRRTRFHFAGHDPNKGVTGVNRDRYNDGSIKHSLLKQSSLDLLTIETPGLKKNDSFSRWMSKELEELDAYVVNPSLSQDQLFSILDVSPGCAYIGTNTKVCAGIAEADSCASGAGISLAFYMEGPWAAMTTTGIFLAVAVTDWLDGYIARKMQLGTPFGAFLDNSNKYRHCRSITNIARASSTIPLSVSMSSSGSIDPTAWEDKKCKGESRFPAQVRIRVRKLCKPLCPVLHHYDGPKFRLELSIAEDRRGLIGRRRRRAEAVIAGQGAQVHHGRRLPPPPLRVAVDGQRCRHRHRRREARRGAVRAVADLHLAVTEGEGRRFPCDEGHQAAPAAQEKGQERGQDPPSIKHLA
uniref:DCD domain-containing protein n=1 Tax=Zea mays TaxID=4577 RepID=A0A804NZY5_MAIZE